jgi:hypothetical protein
VLYTLKIHKIGKIVTSGKLMKVPLASDLTLVDAELAPNVSESLISVYRILRQGYDVWFDHKSLTGNIGSLEARDSPLLTAAEVNGSFHVPLPTTSGCASLASNYFSKKSTPSQRLHERFAHVNFHHLLATVKAQAARGLPSDLDISNHSCTSCVLGKMHTQPFESHPPHYEPLRELCADLTFPPRSVPSLGGSTALLGIYDCGSTFTIVHPVRTKSEFARRLIDTINWLQRQSGKPVKAVRMDKAPENLVHYVKAFCRQAGIEIRVADTAQHQQNSPIERVFRTVWDAVSTMLVRSDAPENLWAEAAVAFVYVRNRVFNSHTVTLPLKKTPFEILFGRLPNVSFFRPWGCLAFASVPSKTRPLKESAVLGRFVRYSDIDGIYEKERTYRILPKDTDASTVITTRNVIFYEDVFDPSQLRPESLPKTFHYPVILFDDETPYDVGGLAGTGTGTSENRPKWVEPV